MARGSGSPSAVDVFSDASQYGGDVASAFVDAFEKESKTQIEAIAKDLVDPVGAAARAAAKGQKEAADRQKEYLSQLSGASRAIVAVGQATTGGIDGVAAAMAALGPEGAVVGVALSTLDGRLSKLNATIQGLVGAYNPAQLERFNYAWDDLLGTMEPVVEAMTEGLRFMADVVASNVGPIRQFVGAMVEGAKALIQMGAKVLAIAALLQGSGTADFGPLGGLIQGLSNIDDKKGAGSGFAAGRTGFQSLEGLGENTKLAAFRVGGKTAEELQSETVDQLRTQVQVLRDVLAALQANQARAQVAANQGRDF